MLSRIFEVFGWGVVCNLERRDIEMEVWDFVCGCGWCG